MRRFLWTIFALWTVTGIFAVMAMSVPVSQTCQRGIISIRAAWNLNNHIRDFRTGVEASQTDSRPHQISPNRHYRFTTIIPDNHDLVLTNRVSGESRMLYTGDNRLSAYWSADSASLYVHQRYFEDGVQNSEQHLRINVETGEILADYVSGVEIIEHSANRRHLLIGIPTEFGSRLAVINTITGEQINYDYAIQLTNLQFSWSHDENWLAVSELTASHIFNTETGEPHPQFIGLGTSPQWTNDSLWFSQNNSIWQASLSDNSLTQMQTQARDFTVSPNNRWLLYEHEFGKSIHLVDQATQMTYPIFDDVDDLVFVWQADFSDDSRCLVIVSRQNAYQQSYEVRIFDLDTMQIIYSLGDQALGENSPNSHYEFYEADS